MDVKQTLYEIVYINKIKLELLAALIHTCNWCINSVVACGCMVKWRKPIQGMIMVLRDRCTAVGLVFLLLLFIRLTLYSQFADNLVV